MKCSIFFQEITIRLLQSAMLSLPESKGFLVDGFPREISQGEQFEREVNKCLIAFIFPSNLDLYAQKLFSNT